MSLLLSGTLAALLLTSTPALAQGGGAAPSLPTAVPSSTTAGPSLMTAAASLKLAKNYTAPSFMADWDWFTDNDPTGGYVNYVSLADAQSMGLTGQLGDGSFVMRADAETRAAGRGRNSVRISSKAQFRDGVYILDVNHMPVGCGTWPAWWTTTEKGWPSGGEIDIIEGANALPAKYGAAYNVTLSAGLANATVAPLARDVASLHTADSCVLDSGAYMTGAVGSAACSAYLNGNSGCGVELAGESLYGADSFGAGVNAGGGGWYAMWRDVANSGGVYVYYWPRDAANVPDDVRNPGTTTTNTANWGQPGANLSVPSCKKDFDQHTIVFDLTFCGDYAGATYASSGCPSVCSSFVQNNPAAFAEAYWSINSLRVYTADGKAIEPPALAGKYIAAIVVSVLGTAGLAGLLWWRYRSRRNLRRRNTAAAAGLILDEEEERRAKKARSGWAMGDLEDRSDPSDPGRRLSVNVVPYALDGAAGSYVGLNPASAAASRKNSTWTTGSAYSSAESDKEHEHEPGVGFASPAGSRRASTYVAPSTARGSVASGANEGAYGGKGAAGPMLAGGRRASRTAEVQEDEGAKRKINKSKGAVGLIGTAKPRTGRTTLAEGKTARHYLDGETRHGHYHDELDAQEERQQSTGFNRPGAKNSFIG